MKKSDSSIKEFIQAIPKTEIHIHMEAAVTAKSYKSLNEKYNINPDLKSEDDIVEMLKIKNLSDMIKHFLYFQTFFKEPEDFLLMVTDLGNYALQNNIYYMETFFSPSMVVRENNVSFNEALQVIVKGLDVLCRKHDLDIRVIVDVSRSFGVENAQNNYDLLKKFLNKNKTDRIIGIGLGGAEIGNSCVPYAPIFKQAKQEGFHVVAHAGEEVDSSSIRDAIHELGAERIGHATSAKDDPELMEEMVQLKIPIEVCPTSNIITQKYVKKMSEHPLKEFHEKGMVVTINTDDPLLFSIDLNNEYYNLVKHLGFDRESIGLLVKNNLFATFLTDEEKEKHWNRVSTSMKVKN